MATCPKCGTTYPTTVRICTKDGTVLAAEPNEQDAQVGKVLDGKYRLDAFLSHGGMGSVYRATHIMLDKTVAVKLIKPELVTSPDVVRRFQREARAASNLNHPNIVAVYDLGQADDGTLYIAMELIDGPSLKDVIRGGGPMPSARIVRILGEVGSALSLAHKNNIIHRDLKPHNIMLATGTEGREVAKLLDFGIAKTFDDAATQLTMTGFALGTPQYMAPEQAAGREVDGRTDLYSVGVILYEMLIGEVPFNDPSTPAILVKQMTEAPEPPSRRKPGVAVSPSLEAIALKCLEKDPARRFENADALIQALNAADVSVGVSSAADVPTVALSGAAAGSLTRLQQDASTIGAKVPPPQVPAPQMTAATTIPGARSQASADVAGVAASTAAIPAVSLTGAVTVGAPSAARSMTSVPAPVEIPPMPSAVSTPSVQSVSATPSSGTHPTVPAGQTMAVPAAQTRKSSGAGLWLMLAAVAVLLVGVGLASQMGYLPWGGGQRSADATTPAAAPAGSPAMADSQSANKPPAADASSGGSLSAVPANQTGGASSTEPPASAQAAAPGGPALTAAQTSPAGPAASTSPAASAALSSSASAQRPTSGRVESSSSSGAASVVPDSSASVRSRASASPSGQARVQASAGAGAQSAPPQQSQVSAGPALPENPPVLFRCSGAPEICGSVRAHMDQALERSNMPAVRVANRAAVIVTANASVVQERINRDFGTTLATRTYSVDLTGETREGDSVAMPPTRTFSFDAQFGRDRLEENAKLISDDVVERVRAYWKKRQQQ